MKQENHTRKIASEIVEIFDTFATRAPTEQRTLNDAVFMAAMTMLARDRTEGEIIELLRSRADIVEQEIIHAMGRGYMPPLAKRS